jgi:hypothetical protein
MLAGAFNQMRYGNMAAAQRRAGGCSLDESFVGGETQVLIRQIATVRRLP